MKNCGYAHPHGPHGDCPGKRVPLWSTAADESEYRKGSLAAARENPSPAARKTYSDLKGAMTLTQAALEYRSAVERMCETERLEAKLRAELERARMEVELARAAVTAASDRLRATILSDEGVA